MKRIILLLLILYPVFCFAQHDIYVAPSPGGNDLLGDGSIASPFATLHKAQTEARNHIGITMTEDVNIIVRSGTYRLTQPLTFTDQDSGKNGYKVRYKAYNNEQVIISGGARVTPPAWSDPNSDGIWEANLASLSPPVFRQMWVNGEKAQRSSHQVTLTNPVNYTTYSVDYVPDQILNRHLARKTDLQVSAKWKWHHNFLMIDDISTSTITFNKETYFDKIINENNDTDYQKIISIENALEFVDTPGEWYYNKDSKQLYYYPIPGEEPNKTQVEVIVPVLEKLISATDVSHMEFQGLTFSHATWTTPNDHGYISGQALVYFEFDQNAYDQGNRPNIHHRDTHSNIEFTESRNVVVSDCKFTHLGAVALSFEEHSADNEVSNNVFTDISGAAIQIGNGKNFKWRAADIAYVTKNNLVTGNTISNVANEYLSHIGIFLGYVQNTTVSNNVLSDLPYTGISIGFPVTEDDNDNTGTLLGANTLDSNTISNVVHTLSDGGAIYNFGYSRHGQSFITNNEINNIPPPPQENPAPRAAIYLDEFTNNFRVADNFGTALAYHGPANQDIFQNIVGCDGKENIFENNDFEGCNTHWIYQKSYNSPYHLATANLDFGVKFVDVNDDQLKDMIYFRWVNGGTVQKGVYLNNGHGWDPKLSESSPLVPPYHLAVDVAGGDMGVQFVDVDGDGLEDMLYCRENYPSQCKAYKNTGAGWQYMPQYNPPKPHFNSNIGDLGVRYIDVDHDNDKDLVYFRWTINNIQDKGVYLNNGSGWDSQPLPPTSPHVPPYHISADYYGGDMGVKFVDLNGDDKLDMLYWRWSPSQKGAYLNTAAGWQYAANYIPKQPMFDNSIGDLGVSFADVDHDGSKDFIVHRVVNANQTDQFVYLNKNNTWQYTSDCTYLPPMPISTDQKGNQGVQFVDLNFDGYEDLVQAYWQNGLIAKTYLNGTRSLVCNGENNQGGTAAPASLLGFDLPGPVDEARIVTYPNPFNDKFSIAFEVTNEDALAIMLYNSRGAPVKSFGRASYKRGKYELEIDGADLPVGIYILKIESKFKSVQKKLIKLSE